MSKLAAALLLAALVVPGVACGAGGLPWEVWKDLARIAELPARDQVLERSSFCPGGCRFDRHSAGDRRFLYQLGEEGIIFDEPGAGAITRIWMTMGPGVSAPLDPTISIRIYLDGAAVPAVDVPLPLLFDGSTPPFVPPLVADRLTSSGGNVSYVPIPYSDGCRVALVGAADKRIWFQFHYHRYAGADAIETFVAGQAFPDWAALMSATGSDPWTVTNPGELEHAETIPAAVDLDGNEAAVVAATDGPDLWTALRVRASPLDWSHLELRLQLDGRETVRMPLADFFAIGREESAPASSLFAGLDADGYLYFYAPLAFFEGASLSLANLSPPGSGSIHADVELRRQGRAPSPDSGIFGAALVAQDPTTTGEDLKLLELDGHGRWFGLFAELGSVATTNRFYLEGDERVYVDGSPHPALYGTGVEDFFGGGFYFDGGNFALPLNGSPYHLSGPEAGGEDVTAAYRWMPTDGASFESSILAGLEGGPLNDVSMRARMVAYYYLRAEPRLTVADSVEIGDPDSRAAHAWSSDETLSLSTLDSSFEGEPPVAFSGQLASRTGGAERFALAVPPGDDLFRLRRRYDAAAGLQAAEIFVGERPAAAFPVAAPDAPRRWQEVAVDLAPDALPDEDGRLHLEVVASASPDGSAATFTASKYELLSGRRECAELVSSRLRVAQNGRFTISARFSSAVPADQLDPRGSFELVASITEAAVYLRPAAEEGSWGRSRAERTRFLWEGQSRGLLAVRLVGKPSGLWRLRVRGRNIVGGSALADSLETPQVEIEIGAHCFRS